MLSEEQLPLRVKVKDACLHICHYDYLPSLRTHIITKRVEFLGQIELQRKFPTWLVASETLISIWRERHLGSEESGEKRLIMQGYLRSSHLSQEERGLYNQIPESSHEKKTSNNFTDHLSYFIFCMLTQILKTNSPIIYLWVFHFGY